MADEVRIGLALGAGGARGVSHIGVLKALERVGVVPAALTGSSIGALVGAGYAVGRNAAGVEKRLMEFLHSPVFKDSGLALMRDAYQSKTTSLSERLEIWLKRTYVQAKFMASPSILDQDTYKEVIDYLLPDINIEDLSIPFRAVGTDIRSGRAVIFKTGSLRSAVYASTAIPGVVPPLKLGELMIADGGVLNMVPVVPLRHMDLDAAIAVDVEKPIESCEEYLSALELLFRVEDIQNNCLREMHLKFADLVIRPDVGHIHWSDFQRAAEIIRLGEDEAARRMDDILALTKRRKRIWHPVAPPPAPVRNWIEV